METAAGILAGIGVLVSLVFMLAGAGLLVGLPVIGLGAAMVRACRASWRGARAGTPLV